MSFRNLFVGALAVVAVSACSSAKDNPAPANATTPPPAAQGSASDTSGAAAYKPGVPEIKYMVGEGPVKVDNADSSAEQAKNIQGYDQLNKAVATIESVKRAVKTKENALELYNGDELVLAYDLRSEPYALLSSKGEFQAEKVTYVESAASNQSKASAQLTFNLKECKTEEVSQVKEENVAPAPVQQQQQQQGQVKEEKVVPAPVQQQQQQQQQQQGQVKEEKVVPTTKETCKTVAYTKNLNEIEEAKQEPQQQQQQQQGQVKEEKVAPAPVEEKKTAPVQEQGQVKEEKVAPAPVVEEKKTVVIEEKKPAPVQQENKR